MSRSAETVTIQGQSYLKREPLGVLGLTVVTLGIYFFYWYWKINDELRLYTGDGGPLHRAVQGADRERVWPDR